LASRFQDGIFDFKDYTDAELKEIWMAMTKSFCPEAPWTISDEAAAIGARRIGRLRGPKFSNARSVEKLLTRSIEAAKIRKDTTLHSKVITIVDIIGPHPMDNPQVKEIMRKVDKEGWEAPKRCFEAMLRAMNEIYEQDLRGDVGGSTTLQLNRVFRGPSGTGKSEASRLYAELLSITRFVSVGHFVPKKAGDFEGQHEGDTAAKVRDIFQKAEGGVLFIDEAPNLCNSLYGKNALDIIVEEMQSQDIAVVVAGYDDVMADLFKQNPGLNSRFGSRSSDIVFQNYPLSLLFRIAKTELQKQSAQYDGDRKLVEAAIEKRIEIDMKQPRFGNARDVKEGILPGANEKRFVAPTETKQLEIIDVTL
jgi:hypothetical protein